MLLADVRKAAKDIVNGATFDNNLPCIAEKEIVAMDGITALVSIVGTSTVTAILSGPPASKDASLIISWMRERRLSPQSGEKRMRMLRSSPIWA